MPSQNTTKAGGFSNDPEEFKPFQQGRNYLFVISINEYQHHNHLYNAVEDAKAFVETLTGRYNFLQEHVTQLYNGEATYENILEQLASYQQLATNDNLLIYFSGHGFYKNKVGYLVPSDAKASPPGRFIYNSALFDELSQIPAHHILLIADSCFSGSLFKNIEDSTRAVAEKVEKIPSRYAMSAGNIELVSDGLVGNHSPFARELLKVLRANEKPKLPVSHVFYEVRSMITYAKQQPLGGPIHRLNEHLGGEFVFCLQQNEKEAFEKAKASRRKQELIDFLDTSTKLEHKKIVRQILREVEAEEAWRLVNKNSYAALDEFLDEYPGNQFFPEVRQRKIELKAQTDANIQKRKEEEEQLRKEAEETGHPYLEALAANEQLKKDAAIANAESLRRVADKQNNEKIMLLLEGLRRHAHKRSLDPFHDLMVHIEDGTFLMGDEYGDLNVDSKPIHKVNVKDFYLSKYPVTQAQWKQIMGSEFFLFRGYHEKIANLPINEISWQDAQTFLIKLNLLTGRRYRLPSEAEWEFAARGGIKSGSYKFSGSDDINEVGWYLQNSGKKSLAGEFDEEKIKDNNCNVHPVGKKKANELGLYDMSGNIWEWCEDDWHENYKGSPVDGSPWKSGGTTIDRVARGGSWLTNKDDCRVAFRAGVPHDERFYDIGFRIAHD